MKFFKSVLKILPLAYMILIWVLSSMPSNAVVELPDSSVDRFIKESLHLVEFAILYILLVIAFLSSGKLTYRLNILCAVIAASYGVIDEIHQSFYSYRSSSIIDVLKDFTGVLVCWLYIQKKYFAQK